MEPRKSESRIIKIELPKPNKEERNLIVAIYIDGKLYRAPDALSFLRRFAPGFDID